jgi:hypothetical protein
MRKRARLSRRQLWQRGESHSIICNVQCIVFYLHMNKTLVRSHVAALVHGYAIKEGCRTERKSRNLEYAMGVRLTGFTA